MGTHMRPRDGQQHVIEAIKRQLDHPALTAEQFGRILLTLDGFVRSGLVTQTEASAMLADRRGDTWSQR